LAAKLAADDAATDDAAVAVADWRWEVLRLTLVEPQEPEAAVETEAPDDWLILAEDDGPEEPQTPKPLMPMLKNVQVLDAIPEGHDATHILWAATEAAAKRLAYQCLRDARLFRLQGDLHRAPIDFVVRRLPADEPHFLDGEGGQEGEDAGSEEVSEDARLMTSVLTRARERDSIYRVVELLQELTVHGVEPNGFHINTLLQGCKRPSERVEWQEGINTRGELAVGLWAEMIYRGVHRDVVTYNGVIESLLECGDLGRRAAWRIFQAMRGLPSSGDGNKLFGVETLLNAYPVEPPNVFTYTVLSRRLTMPVVERKSSYKPQVKFEKYMQKLDSKVPASANPVAAPPELLELFRAMQEDENVAPDEFLWATLVKTMADANEVGAAREAFERVRKVVERRIADGGAAVLPPPPGSRLTGNVIEVAGTSLMRALTANGRFDEALAVLEDVEATLSRSGPAELSAVTIGVKIDVLGQAGRLDEAIAVLRDLDRQSLVDKATSATVNVLCKWLGRHGRVDEALAIFRQVMAVGMQPDAVSYNTLLEGVIFRKDPRVETKRLMEVAIADPKANPDGSDAASFEARIVEIGRSYANMRAEHAVAWNLIAEMEGSKNTPTRWTINSLLYLLLKEALVGYEMAATATAAANHLRSLEHEDKGRIKDLIVKYDVVCKTAVKANGNLALRTLQAIRYGRRHRMHSTGFTYNTAMAIASVAMRSARLAADEAALARSFPAQEYTLALIEIMAIERVWAKPEVLQLLLPAFQLEAPTDDAAKRQRLTTLNAGIEAIGALLKTGGQAWFRDRDRTKGLVAVTQQMEKVEGADDFLMGPQLPQTREILIQGLQPKGPPPRRGEPKRRRPWE